MGIDSRLKHVFADAVDGFADVRHVQQFVTLLDVSDVSETINSIREDVFKATIDAHIPPQSLEEQFVTLGVNRPALVVGHIIIFQQLLTNIEVTALN
jgi:hypothetical protein